MNNEKEVTGITYDSHDKMVKKVLKKFMKMLSKN